MQLLVNPGIGRLNVLSGYEAVNYSTEMLFFLSMGRLIKGLKRCYKDRTVAVDMPPRLVTNDVLNVARDPTRTLQLWLASDPKDKNSGSIEALSRPNLLRTAP